MILEEILSEEISEEILSERVSTESYLFGGHPPALPGPADARTEELRTDKVCAQLPARQGVA